MPKLFFALFSLLFCCGCSAGPRYLAKDYRAPVRVAVLPCSNLTNDVTAPDTLRKVLQQALPSRGFTVVDSAAVDQVLEKKFGITEGGQLGSASPEVLGQALAVDGLFYGEVLSFIDLPLGYVRKRTVKANLRLVDAKTGAPLWEDQRGWTTPELFLDPNQAKHAAARQVAERQAEKMTGTFLLRETQVVVDRLLDNLPGAR